LTEPSAKKIIDFTGKKFENKNQLLKKLSVPHKRPTLVFSCAVIKVNGYCGSGRRNLRPVYMWYL